MPAAAIPSESATSSRKPPESIGRPRSDLPRFERRDCVVQRALALQMHERPIQAAGDIQVECADGRRVTLSA